MVARLKIYDFIECELNHLRNECNFTDIELEYFNLKAKAKSNTHIAYALNVSENTVVNVGNKVKQKIKKVLEKHNVFSP